MSNPKGKPPLPPSEKKKETNSFLNMVYFDEISKKNNKDFGLFANYQINPYTKKTIDFVTPKVNTRPPKLCLANIPGYDKIKEAIRKSTSGPMDRFCEPQTEGHRIGWMTKGQGYFDRENYDDRFKFSHQTAEFIKTQAMIKEYDRLMGNLMQNKGGAAGDKQSSKKPWS